MEDPTTITLNLTFFGTVFVAFVMFLGLFVAFIVMLVLAGVGRLLALVLMALFGRLPRNDTIEVVRLPADGQQAAVGPDAGQSAPVEERPAKERSAKGRTAKQPRAPRPVRAPRPAVDWKALLTRAGLREALHAAVAHHPLLTAARPVPPVLAKDWAEAVAAADARAVARARAVAPVLGIPVPEAPVTGVGEVVKVAPLVETALHEGLHDDDRAPLVQVPPRPARMPGAGSSKDVQATKQVHPANSSLTKTAESARPGKKAADAGHMAILDTGSMVSLAQHTEARVRS
ncbi:MAG: hypothetical protein K0R37_971 [Arthrobacter sp.]|nr:hypothetical protein [Arthrobacter sp.]